MQVDALEMFDAVRNAIIDDDWSTINAVINDPQTAFDVNTLGEVRAIRPSR